MVIVSWLLKFTVRKKIIFAVFLLFSSVQLSLGYYSLGQPAGFVNDYAEMMSGAARQSVEVRLQQFEKETSNEISVVTIESLKDDTIENFAEKLFKEWGIGKEDKDNGVLLLIAKEDRQMRIEVGYGLEGALTDAQSFWIIQNVMRPAFQTENYDQGISESVDKIIAATKGEYVPSQTQTETRGINFKTIETLLFFAFFVFIWLGAILARSKSWWAGGVIGAIIGIILIFVFSWFVGLIAILVLAPLGLLFDFLVSRAYQTNKAKGLRPPWWAGGGFGGRGGGRSGFGGFGGGMSGGGGASGRW